MKVNWKVRFMNKTFLTQVFLAFLLPILAFYNLKPQDLTTWEGVGSLLLSFVSNPFLIATVLNSVWSAVNDPTVKGVISDSSQALKYDEPKEDDNYIIRG